MDSLLYTLVFTQEVVRCKLIINNIDQNINQVLLV